MIETELRVPTPDGAMTTFIAHPNEGGDAPVVVIYMDAMGYREALRDVARRIASNGYYAVLPDLFYRWGEGILFDPAKILAGDEDEIARATAMSRKLTDEDAMSDTRALLDHVAGEGYASAGPKGCIGLCMGGRFVVRALSKLPEEFAAGSSLHPSFLVTEEPDSPHLELASIRGELYLGYGEADQRMPTFSTMPPMREELQRHGIAHQIDVHPDADHGYMIVGHPVYQEAAAEAAWKRTFELFDRRLDDARPMRTMLLVGSVNRDDAEDVFRTVAEVLGADAFAIPDGETGFARSVWIQCQIPFFIGHRQVEMVEPGANGCYRPAGVGPGGIYSHTRAGMFKGRARVRDGVDAAEIVFDNLGYAEWAMDSYETFARLKREGAIAPGTRFLVDIPTPSALAPLMLPSDIDLIMPAYARGLGNEVRKTAAGIPHEELAIQFSTTEPCQYESMAPEQREQTRIAMAAAAAYVPEDVPLGYHLCYGDFEHKHTVEPPDLSVPVEIANALSQLVERTVDWFHMPVPLARKDDAYFAPLGDLELRSGSEVNLGLIHEADGIVGTRERIGVAGKYVSDFGVSTECGLGRRQPDAIPDILRLYLEAARS